MTILSNANLRQELAVKLPPKTPYYLSKEQKIENINTFCNLSREDLIHNQKERRILMYETQNGEKIFYQYPGKESLRKDMKKFTEDARPILIKSNNEQAPDMDFKKIWDIIDYLGSEHKSDADILGVIFLRIAYMYQYLHTSGNFTYEDRDVTLGQTVNFGKLHMEWNHLFLSPNVIESLNDKFKLPNHYGFSFEAFLYYNDILAQNEDNKYYLRASKDPEQILQKGSGRINNCLSHLTVISHIRGKIGISKLIDSFQRLGVAPLPKARFNEACGDLVITQATNLDSK